MTSNRSITVFGAYGHTGRFIVAELRRRGWSPILSGRDVHQLKAMADANGGLEVRAASIDDAASLDQAIAGATAVINSAGPFAFTAAPVIEAALRTRTPYLDVAAEPEVVAATFENYASRARSAGIIIAPAVAFYGGLASCLASAAMGGWPEADDIRLAYALSSWKPTLGTRATIAAAKERRAGRRLVFTNGRLEFRTDDAPTGEWTFPAPIGKQAVVAEFTTADAVTLSQHVKVGQIHEYMTLAPLRDLSGPDLSPPPSVDASGRSAQTFLIEVVVTRGGEERRAVVSGQDIYAVTAPIVVEAAVRVIANRRELSGVLASGQISDAREFLRSLAPDYLTLELQD